MSPRLPRITAVELLRALQRAGWEVKRQGGGPLQLKHPSKPGRVTIAYHAGSTLKPKVLLSALEQAGLTVEEMRELL